MSNKPLLIVATALAWCGLCANGQGLKVDFPKDSPVSPLTTDFSPPISTASGGANLIEVNTTLSLRNSGQKRIRSMTLMVSTQDGASSGKGSVSVPTLDAGPGETFSIHIGTRLIQPLSAG